MLDSSGKGIYAFNQDLRHYRQITLEEMGIRAKPRLGILTPKRFGGLVFSITIDEETTIVESLKGNINEKVTAPKKYNLED